MHRYDDQADELATAIIEYALARVRMDPPPLDGPQTEAELRASVGDTIIDDGLGGLQALRLFIDKLAPATISVDHPRFFAFVPAAPTEAAILFDLVVGASSLFGGTWLEASGAVYAENQALRWLADLVGLPASGGGVFVSGGSAGNLSGLVAARHAWRRAHPQYERVRGAILTGIGAHSSVLATARVMDVDVITVHGDDRDRLTGPAVRDALAENLATPIFAVVATAGATNTGLVDDLAGVAQATKARDLWLHVDGAYGGAALAAPSARPLFTGVEHADSFVVDPHKWLFAPFDCAALLYRDVEVARQAHTQHAAYLDAIHREPEWNPSDLAYHLTRRARGLPFWFSLATHGTRRYRDAIESTLALTLDVARMIDEWPELELVMEPHLSVLLFRRLGWLPADYQAWSDRVLADGLTFTVPTTWRGETVLRFCFVNPRTTLADVRVVLESLI